MRTEEQRRQEIMEIAEQLQPDMLEGLLWTARHMEFLLLIAEGKALTETERETYWHKAVAEQDYEFLSLFIFKQIWDKRRANEQLPTSNV